MVHLVSTNCSKIKLPSLSSNGRPHSQFKQAWRCGWVVQSLTLPLTVGVDFLSCARANVDLFQRLLCQRARTACTCSLSFLIVRNAFLYGVRINCLANLCSVIAWACSRWPDADGLFLFVFFAHTEKVTVITSPPVEAATDYRLK